MMTLRIIKPQLFLLLFFTLLSCNNVKNNNIDQDLLIWDDYDICEWTDSTISSKVSSIILKSTPSTYLKSIEKVAICENNLYILDVLGRKIIKYDMSGHPVGLLHCVGRGPGEYIHLDDFCIDSSGHIYTLDCSRSIVNEYDKEFKFCRQYNLQVAVDQISVLPDGGFLLSLSPFNSGKFEDAELVSSSHDFKEMSVLAYYDAPVSLDEVISLPLISVSDGGRYYHRTVTDYAYKIDKGYLNRIFFDFGKNSVPKKFRTNLSKNLSHYSSYITLLQYYTEMSDKVYGMLYRFGKENIFVLNKQHKTVSFREVENPFYTYSECASDSIWEYPIGVSDKYFITCMSHRNSVLDKGHSGNLDNKYSDELNILRLYDISENISSI